MMTELYHTTMKKAFDLALQYNKDVLKGVEDLRILAQELDPDYSQDEVIGEFEVYLMRYEEDIQLQNELGAIVQEIIDTAYEAEEEYYSKNN